jgi:hypothetical protein
MIAKHRTEIYLVGRRRKGKESTMLPFPEEKAAHTF